MIGSRLRLSHALVVCACLAAALAAPAEGQDLALKDVWFYAPMDGTLAPEIDENCYDVPYRQWTKTAVADVAGPRPEFVDGLAGKAVFIGAPTDRRKGDALHYLLDARGFPVKAGTIAVWFRPTRPLAKENTWLYGAGWVTFQAVINGARIGVHATGENRDAIYSDIRDFAKGWPNRWHLFVCTWDGPRMAGYLDGKRIGGKRDAKPMDRISTILEIGSLRPGGARKTPVAYAEAAYDDIVILAKPLTPEQVARLYASGTKEGFGGFLHFLGEGARVTMKRRAYLRGETATVNVTPFGNAGAAQLVATNAGKSVARWKVSAREPSVVEIDTQRLRPGAYGLHVELTHNGNRVGRSAPVAVVVRGRRQPEFPVGLGGEFGVTEETLALYEKLHISLISGNGPQGDVYFWKQLDRCFAHGICLYPNFNILEVWGRQYESLKRKPYFRKDAKGKWRVDPEWGWKYLQTLKYADGSPDNNTHTSSASPFSPIAWKMMTARIGQIMARAGDHPGLLAVSFQDEVPFRMGHDKKTRKLRVGDYSHSAVEHFKKRTGLKKAAFPPDDPPGTVWPEDHPYLLWARHVGLPGNDFTNVGFDDLYGRLGREVKKARPDVLVGNYSGGEYGRNDFVLDWQYPVIWALHAWGSGAGGGYLDYIFDRHWARQDARPRKPLWALLGWWSGNMAKQPEWCAADFRLNTAWALAKGCKQLMWFSAGHGPLSGEKSGPFSHPSIRGELEKWAGFLHEKGAVFARLEKRPYGRTAVLWSKTNRAGHVLKTKVRPAYHLVFSGLRNIGACPDLVTDRMLREGCLEGYEALVLCGFNYSSTDLWRKIQAFAATPGKTVFVDTTSKLVPGGAVSLKADWHELFQPKGAKGAGPRVRSRAVGRWANHLRPIVTPRLSRSDLEVADASGLVGAHLLWAGDTPYLFVLNTDMDSRRAATVGLKHSGNVAYDLRSGERIRLKSAAGRVSLSVALEPGGAKMVVLPNAEIKQTKLKALWRDHKIGVRVDVQGPRSVAVKAALPLCIEVFDPDGNRAYERFTSTDKLGVWAGEFTLGNLTDLPGRWRVDATELLTGARATARVVVRREPNGDRR